MLQENLGVRGGLYAVALGISPLPTLMTLSALLCTTQNVAKISSSMNTPFPYLRI